MASGKNDQLFVICQEGFAPELDLIRQNRGIDASNHFPSEWTGWASIDSMNSVFAGQEPNVSGAGWVLIDKNTNLPPSGEYQFPIDFKAAYKKAWGVGT